MKKTLPGYVVMGLMSISILTGMIKGIAKEPVETKSETRVSVATVPKGYAPVTEIEEVEIFTETTEFSQDLDKQELDLLARLINGEVGACSYEAKYLTGSVVLNRVAADYFYQDNIEDVIYAPGQYECTWLYDSGFYKEPSEECYEVAEELLRNGTTIPSNVVFQAEFVQGDEIYKYVDGEYFCSVNR